MVNPLGDFSCKICDKTFKIKCNLKRHLTNVHAISKSNLNLYVEIDASKCRIICPFEGCDQSVSRQVFLNDHLKTIHGVDIIEETLEFSSYEEFEEWRHVIQDETCSEYVKNSGTRTLADGSQRTTFLCSRSFEQQNRREGRKRCNPSKGSKKTGIFCPSKIEVWSTTDGEKRIFVNFFKTHCGHGTDLSHHRIDSNSRHVIAEKLRAGISFKKLLDSIRDGDIEHLSKRARIIDAKDLHNICRDFKIPNPCQRLRNESESSPASPLSVNLEIDSLFEQTNKCTVDVSTKTRVERKINLLAELWGGDVDPDVGLSVEKLINSAIDKLSSSTGSEPIQKTEKSVSTNQKIGPELGLLSTKKNRSLKTVKNPTQNEEKSVLMGGTDINQISINVHSIPDHLYCKT